MTWFKVDDRLPTHRKVMSIPRGARRMAAIGAWTLCGAWVAGNGNDGHVPAHVLEDFGIPAKAATDLVTSGLWEPVEDGFLIHDYLDYNPTGEQIAIGRAAAAERQRRAREKAASRRDSHVTHTDVTGAVTDPRHGPPDPTRPDPEVQTPSVSAARKRATTTPTPDVFPVTEAMEAWAREKHPLVTDLHDQTERFLDYHRGKGSRQADWGATWRTWIRNATKYAEERPSLRAVPSDRYGSWDV